MSYDEMYAHQEFELGYLGYSLGSRGLKHQ